MPKFQRFLLFFLILIILVNIIGLWTSNYFLFKKFKNINNVAGVQDSSGVAQSAATENNNQNIISKIQEDLAALTERVAKLENKPETGGSVSVANSSFQKQTIYLGNASTHNQEWEDTGLEIALNSADYPSNIKIKFEIALSIIGGEVWVRLKNKTTGVLLTQTELMHNTNNATWKSAPAFNLHRGNNIYLIQLKSTSGEKAVVHGARLILEK